MSQGFQPLRSQFDAAGNFSAPSSAAEVSVSNFSAACQASDRMAREPIRHLHNTRHPENNRA
jgi:hypothetical protein